MSAWTNLYNTTVDIYKEVDDSPVLVVSSWSCFIAPMKGKETDGWDRNATVDAFRITGDHRSDILSGYFAREGSVDYRILTVRDVQSQGIVLQCDCQLVSA